MLWREELIPVNPFSRPGIPLRTIRKIVCHWTANPGASAAAHVRYFGQTLANQNPYDDIPDRYASAHIFVDKTEAVLVIPLNEVAYHAGPANTYSIGVEMCVEEDGNFHPDTVERTAKIVAELCDWYGLDPIRDVIRHYDVTGKICPKPYVIDPWAWQAFRQKVDSIMKGDDVDMQEIEKLKKEVEDLKNQVKLLLDLHKMDVPEWAKSAVGAAVMANLIDTPEGGSFDFYRILTILYRAGLIQKKG
jgi:N-acetylmuramoyl-L-alanine amidase